MSSRADIPAELHPVPVSSPEPAKGERLNMEMSPCLPPILPPLAVPLSPSAPGWLRGQVLLSPPLATARWKGLLHPSAPLPAPRGFGKEAEHFFSLKWISGPNGPDKALRWGFQHLLLGSTPFPSASCRSQISLRLAGEQIPQESFHQVWFSLAP